MAVILKDKSKERDRESIKARLNNFYGNDGIFFLKGFHQSKFCISY